MNNQTGQKANGSITNRRYVTINFLIDANLMASVQLDKLQRSKTQELTSYLNPVQTLPPYSVYGQKGSWTVVLVCRSSVSLTGSGVPVQLGPMFEGGALKSDTSLSS